jgi:hypothetical protein
MYIQKYGDPYAKKYYIKRFVDCELNKTYTNNANTTYSFTWEFEKIPQGLTNISIIEPDAGSGYNSWYWKNITIYNPSLTECYSETAKNIANQCAEVLVKEGWQGGTDITCSVYDCDYNSNSGKWSMYVMIEFHGDIITANYYRADGYLNYNKYTNKFNFDPYYKNTKLRNYELGYGLLVASAVIYELSK